MGAPPRAPKGGISDSRGKRERGRHTKEGASGEDRDDERLFVGRKHVAEGVGCRLLTKSPEPVVHCNDAGDGAGIVTVEDTTKGSEGGHDDTCESAL